MIREKSEARRSDLSQRGVALVITLLMLSVITFMAIAFLAISRRERASVTGTLNQADAQAMADAALARAQADLAAFLMSHNTNAADGSGRPNDLLNYDMMMSHNFINPVGFTIGVFDPTNVNYEVYTNGARLSGNNPADWIQNIANLFYDPRPPVYVPTNSAFPNKYDFRYWLDYNRNGQFESNGFVRELDINGSFVDLAGNPTVNPPFRIDSVYGEPEYVGVLRQPDVPHGSNQNTFVGRWAYLALPIGKTLDLNFIHNYAKATATNGFPNTMPNDGFMRNSGHGPWEFNLAGLLFGVNTNLWGTNYLYRTNGAGIPVINQPNRGDPFDDAVTILRYRYATNNQNLRSLPSWFQSNNASLFQNDQIDEYADGPIVTTPFDYQFLDNDNQTAPNPWPGSTNVNSFYEPQDLFNKLDGTLFVNRMTNAMARPDTTNRYTFSRLLASIGTDSDPELSTWVHEDDGKMVKRAKININYDNSKQLMAFNTNPVNVHLTTPQVLTNWDPLTFFTNTAELLLRSQDFAMATNLYNATNVPLGSNYFHFGVTNIPVYSSANTNIHYSDAIHRMLQIAANMLDASGNTNTQTNLPSVFRPLVKQFPPESSNTNLFIPILTTNVYIVGFEAVTDTNFLAHPFKSLNAVGTTNQAPITTNDNVWGIPLVVAARKGLPNFNEYSYSTAFSIERKLEFRRAAVTQPPNLTNQFLTMCISNVFGSELWNSYNRDPVKGTTPYYNTSRLRIWMTNHASISFDYEGGVGTNFSVMYVTNVVTNKWKGYNGQSTVAHAAAMITLLTNVIPLPVAQWSETKREFQLNPIYGSVQLNDSPNAFPYHDWILHVTNHLALVIIDEDTKRIVDAVNIGDFGTSFDVYKELNKDAFQPFNPGGSARSLVWLTNGANHTTSSRMSMGVSNQIAISAGYISVATSEWRDTRQDKIASEQDVFRRRLLGQKPDDSSTDFQAPFSPSATLVQQYTWQANDPLVHYTLDDLTGPELTNQVAYITPMQGTNTIPGNLGKKNKRYSPWPTPNSDVGLDIPERMIYRDPLIYSSDEWNFPTNHFPSVGWIGRVHRGSPWQTIYLKAETDPENIGNDQRKWSRIWAKSLVTYPTNDWRLLDLFTVALNENAARGLLSVNQTNLGPWSAALAGLFVLTGTNGGFTIDPYSTNLDGANIITNIVGGLNQTRTAEDNGVFHHVGDILKVRQLTTGLDIIPPDTLASYPDNVVERLPQQLLSLLKLGDPRFVIYSFGQALKPANNSLVLGGQYRGMCTNYQITGEVVTRSVVRLSNDSTPENPKFIIESFNILPGN